MRKRFLIDKYVFKKKHDEVDIVTPEVFASAPPYLPQYQPT